MARLSDVPKAIRAVGLLTLLQQIWTEVNKDNLFTWAAAMAYSWLFAIFPFLIFLLALIPHLPNYTKAQARGEIHEMIFQLPHEAAQLLWTNVDQSLNSLLQEPQRKLLYLGLIVALWAASGGTSMIMSALDRCYELKKSRAFYWQRLLALGLTVVVVAMVLLIVCLLPVASLVETFIIAHGWFRQYSLSIIFFDVTRWALSIVIMLALLTLLYNNGPNIRQPFRLITPGAIFCLTVWLSLGGFFRLYIDHMGARGYDRTYGTVGGVVVLLFLFYINALALLIGAEINSEIDFIVLGVPRGSNDFRCYEKGTPPPSANTDISDPPAPQSM